jgi:putative sterol carrier protein
MGYVFPSEEWLKALFDVLNSDEQYAEVARNWEGDIAFRLEPEPDAPSQAPSPGGAGMLYLDLWHGKCRRVAVLAEGEVPSLKPTFTLSGPRSTLLRILGGHLDPMQAMVTRKLKVEGNFAYMMKNVPTVLDFVRCCRKVPINP